MLVILVVRRLQGISSLGPELLALVWLSCIMRRVTHSTQTKPMVERAETRDPRHEEVDAQKCERNQGNPHKNVSWATQEQDNPHKGDTATTYDAHPTLNYADILFATHTILLSTYVRMRYY